MTTYNALEEGLVSPFIIHQANGIWFWEKDKLEKGYPFLNTNQFNWIAVKKTIADYIQKEHNLNIDQRNAVFRCLLELK